MIIARPKSPRLGWNFDQASHLLAFNLDEPCNVPNRYEGMQELMPPQSKFYGDDSKWIQCYEMLGHETRFYQAFFWACIHTQACIDLAHKTILISIPSCDVIFNWLRRLLQWIHVHIDMNDEQFFSWPQQHLCHIRCFLYTLTNPPCPSISFELKPLVVMFNSLQVNLQGSPKGVN